MPKRVGVGGLAFALAASGISVLAATPALANTAGTGLVINEVYGAGGNNGAVYNADFVELYNPTSAAISLAGLTVQYRANNNNVGGTTQALSGLLAAKNTYLIQMSTAGTIGKALPTPNVTASTSINMAAAGGQTILGTATTYPTGNLAGAANVVDMVGASGASSFEGTAATVAASTTQSLNRAAEGKDTDVNSADIALAAPSPTAGTVTAPPTDPPPANITPIAEIQGTGTASPKAGTTVTTQGVVTASYPAGGFNGYYLQTGGTGGSTDATPGASDAVFVYAPSLGAANFPALGASVQVSGAVSEFNDATQITSNAFTAVTPALSAVTPLAAAYPTTDAAREAHEGELLAPTNDFTVTNTFSTNQYAEIGLATGDEPLYVPTEKADAQDADAVAAVTADNARRGVVLDDGASINFLPTGNGGNKNIPLPWLTKTKSVSVGARATFAAPIVLDYRNSTWKFQPRTQVTDDGSSVVTFSDQRALNTEPRDVGGNTELATFNVLNYFPTTAASVNCTSTYKDREGNPITANTCPDPGPRGAADDANLKRQQDKIVVAINKLGADVVSLEEIENSVKFGKTRDDGLSKLVVALNTATGADTWDYVRSPAASALPDLAVQDVIRTAFIYKKDAIVPVGTSKVLLDTAFDNARQPLAQSFKRVGALDSGAFAVIVNHFKSKGSGPDDNTGQGLSNAARVDQAKALVEFSKTVASSIPSGKVFLTGDFNAYSEEDPIQVLEEAGFTDLRGKFDADESTYSFGGQSGSLDHVFANTAALGDVNDADIWNINSGESIAYEYSRYNYNVTDFYTADQYRASDHDPEIVGFDAAGAPTSQDVNLLNINDFHGRIDTNTTKFATTIEKLRAAAGEDNTLFLSAGDNVGASLFASAIQKDKPTIDVLNALGLNASAVGNHEFDQGADDLTGRIKSAANWDYLGANVYQKGTKTPALPEYKTFTVGGVTVGVVGVVTQETPSLVSPAGITNLDFGDPVEAVNRVSDQLSDGNPANGEADVVVAEYHEGAGAALPDTATCAQEINADTVFGKIARTTSANVDVIFTGHTHKQYACDGPIPGVSGKTRPILQTGEYGNNIGQVQLKVDIASKTVTSYTQGNVARTMTEDLSFPRVAQVKQITDAALANAAAVGNQPVGKISASITTAYSGGSYSGGRYSGGTRDDRASESTLGDLVAQALKDGVSQFATPDLGITNPGGLRAELLFAGDTAANAQNTDGVVTYAEANAVLPFNNTVAIVKLTGAQIKAVLEQQYQTNPDGSIPSRPYLQLGLSDNVRVTTDSTAAAGSRITSVRINGVLLDPAKTYTVSTLSFLAAGGDNFRAFTQGTYTDTGLLDAQLFRDYLAGKSTGTNAVSPDFARQQVAAPGLPATVTANQEVSFTVSKLNLTSLGSPANTSIDVFLTNGTTRYDVGSFPVTDGTASVSFTAPAGLTGNYSVGLTAVPSGTKVGAERAGAVATSTTLAVTPASPVDAGTKQTLTATVTPGAAIGTVTFKDGATTIGEPVAVSGGTATTTTTLPSGNHNLTAVFTPTDATAFAGSTSAVTTYLVNPAATTTTLAVTPDSPAAAGTEETLTATITPAAAGTVIFKDGTTAIGDPITVTDGKASTKTTLTPGSHSLTAVFTPTDTTAFAGSTSAATTYLVNPAATTTTLAVTPDSPAAAGTEETLTATITPAAAGTVIFKDGTTTIGTAVDVTDGKATIKTKLASGSHSLTAVFTPTDTVAFTGSTSEVTTYVVNPAATTTTLAVTPDSPAAAGTEETLTATITPAAAGTVIFKDGTTAIGDPITVTDGKASTKTTLTPGSHSLTAVFTPTDTTAFAGSTSAATTYLVNPAATTTTLAVTPDSPAAAGTEETLTATITPAAAGTVIFKDGTTTIGTAVDVTDGKATIKTKLASGSHSLTAVFTPTDTTAFAGSTSEATTYVVNPAAPTADDTALTITAPGAIVYGQTITVGTTVTNARTNAPVANASVQLLRRVAGAADYSPVGGPVTTNASGAASVSLAMAFNTTFRWTFVGTATQTAASSAFASTIVTQIISANRTPATFKAGGTVQLYGAVAPTKVGQMVYFQSFLNGKWVTQLATTVANQKMPDGRTFIGYKFSAKLTKAGAYGFRAYAPPTATNGGVVSASLAVRVT